MTENKKGRPFLFNGRREKISLTLTLLDGCMDELLKKYNTTQKSTAIRNAVHELLGVDEKNWKEDTNSSRQKRKELARELNTTVAKVNRCMEKKNCKLDEVANYPSEL